MSYEAFVLSEETRQHLLREFPPKYPDVVCHHITHRFGVGRDPKAEYGKQAPAIRVVGYSCGDGIEALVVTVGGSEKRPDGKKYHITHSLNKAMGKKPVDSNAIISKSVSMVVGRHPVSATFEYIG